MEGNTKGRRTGAVVAAVVALVSGFGAWMTMTTELERRYGTASDLPWVTLAVVAVMAATFAIALAQPVKRQ